MFSGLFSSMANNLVTKHETIPFENTFPSLINCEFTLIQKEINFFYY